jgi:hypothetical protein
MNFATAFLKYLAKTHFDPRYQTFDLFLEMPKGLKVRKHVTSRIVTQEDVENVLYAIKLSFENGEIDGDYYFNYRSLVLFGTLCGQRPQATTARLTVGQFRAPVSQKKLVIDVLPEQDKIRMQHYVLFIRRWLTLFRHFSMAGEITNLCSNNSYSNGG